MSRRDTMKAGAAPFLAEGEQIQAVFGAQTMSQYFALISIWILIIANGYRVVVATDRRILVFQAGRLRTAQVKELLREGPRDTQIGPARGLWYPCETLGEKMYIGRNFHKDVAAADAAIGK